MGVLARVLDGPEPWIVFLAAACTDSMIPVLHTSHPWFSGINGDFGPLGSRDLAIAFGERNLKPLRKPNYVGIATRTQAKADSISGMSSKIWLPRIRNYSIVSELEPCIKNVP